MNVPKGWCAIRLEEVIESDFDGTWGDETAGQFVFPIIRSTDMRDGRLSFDNVAMRSVPLEKAKKKALRRGDILVNKSSGSSHLVGSSVLFNGTPEDRIYLCSNFVRCLRPDKKRVSPEYLFQYLQSTLFRGQVFGAQRTTSGLRNLKVAEYLGAKVLLPPLAEQQRIVVRIKEMSDLVHEIRTLKEEATEEAKIILPSILRETYISLCKNFTTVPLGELVNVFGGGTPSKKHLEYWQGSIPWVSPKDMKEFEILDSQDHITPQSIEKSSTKLIPPPAVLFVVRGMILIRALPVAISRVPVTVNQDMKALRSKGRVSAEYIAYMLRGATPDLLQKVDIAGHGTRRLKTADWMNCPIPVPPSDKETEIIERLQQAEKATNAMAENCTKLEIGLIQQSILRKAFAGEL